MEKKLFAIILLLLSTLYIHADEDTPNAKQARRIFDIAYNQVFGKEGSKLDYNVNIIGIYKTKGTIWLKEKKQRFKDNRVTSWNDGTTVYVANKKKHTVEIHDSKANKSDKHSSRFKFTLDDFTYSISKESDGLLLTLKQKKKAKGTIKEVRALVTPKTYEPIRLRIKVAFVWTTIHISNFQAGDIQDDIFTFPVEQYKSGWKFVDKR